MSVAKLAARGLIGGLMFGHGMQKLQGWFGGPGLEPRLTTVPGRTACQM